MEGSCLIIVGMHRSGTSFASSILQKAGLNIGKELLGGGHGNIKGHFENCDFFRFHVKALDSLGLNHDGWDLKSIDHLDQTLDEEASQIIQQNQDKQWGWKDPRTTLFLPFWERKLPKAKYLFLYRNPWDVIDSLYRRNSDEMIIKDPIHAFKVWNFYNRAILDMYKRHQHDGILIHVDDIIHDQKKFIQHINETLGFNLEANIEAIFDKSIYNYSVENNSRDAQTAFLCPEALDTLNELRALTGKDNYMISHSSLGQSIISDWQQVGAKTDNLNTLSSELKAFKEAHDQLIAERERITIENQNLKNENQVLFFENTRQKNEINTYKGEMQWMKKTKVWKLREYWHKLKQFHFSIKVKKASI